MKEDLSLKIREKYNRLKGILNKQAILFPILLSFCLCIVLYRHYLDGLPQKYAVGEIYKISKPYKGGTKAYFNYLIDSELYSRSVDIYKYENVAIVGGRFLVSIPKGHDRKGVMLLDFPVPKGIDAPVGGWIDKPRFR